MARQAGDTAGVDGELVEDAAAGTVLLQSPVLDRRVGVVVAVPRSSPCRAGQLAVRYRPGPGGGGEETGTLLLRNTSASWCALRGPMEVIGLTDRQPVTRAVRTTVVADVVLSPRAGAVPGATLSAAQLVASVSLSAPYRDDEAGGSCDAHQVVPSAWRIRLGTVTLTVADGAAGPGASAAGTGGLISCRGWLAGTAPRIATS